MHEGPHGLTVLAGLDAVRPPIGKIRVLRSTGPRGAQLVAVDRAAHRHLLGGPLVPRPRRHVPRGGPPAVVNDQRVEQASYLLQVSAISPAAGRSRDLPPQLGCGSGHTAWRRLRAWQDAGVWDRLHRLVLDGLSDAAVLDWSGACMDAAPMHARRGRTERQPHRQGGHGSTYHLLCERTACWCTR